MLEIKFTKEDKKKWLKRKQRVKKFWEKVREQRVKNWQKKYGKPKQKEPKQPAKEKRSRPIKQKYHKRVKFNETLVGHYMYVYAPVEYHMLLKYMEELRNVDSNTTATSLQYIELLAIHSGNPALKTTTFRKAIIAYQKHGMNPPKKAHWTLRDAVNFAKFSNFIHKQMEECERELP